MVMDSWKIRKKPDVDLVKVLRDPLACPEAIQVATTETLARLLERKK